MTEISYLATPISLDFRVNFIYLLSLFKRLLSRLKLSLIIFILISSCLIWVLFFFFLICSAEIGVCFIYIGIMVWVLTNGLWDQGSFPGLVIPKTQKWYLISPCLTLSIIRSISRVKWSDPGKRVAPSPTPLLWSPTLLFYLYTVKYSKSNFC